MIVDAVGATIALFADKHVALDTELPETVPPIRADRDRIVQVLINLLSNAVKFVAPHEGRFSVRLLVEPDALRVVVDDNGPGVARDEQPMIFEKFRQGGNPTTGKPAGTGIGLPISRQIIDHFRGRLWVESEAGRGASFQFTLPVS